ncbi:MAG: hypothetical protein N2Z20_03790 [Elusimicrobiales bacterium]|nr:hypothetical protein [Elusimicrobiales bacterium]
MSLVISKGSILVYHAFDLGWEIDLIKAEKNLLEKQQSTSRFQFSKDPRRAIIIKEAPLSIDLGQENFKIDTKAYNTNISTKIWDYGALTITIEIILEEGTIWKELEDIAKFLENKNDVEIIAKKIKDEIKQIILPAIKMPYEWEQFEDYITYFFTKINGIDNPKEIFDKVDVAALIMGEVGNKLSSISSLPVTDNYIQYYENDIAIIDWDSALIIEPTGTKDICDAIEFSLTHLLELRYYDYLIDKRLDQLYSELEYKQRGIKRLLKSTYSKIAEEATRNYIEFSDLLGKIENSFKAVGDPYIATVFRTCAEQFRFDDWYKSISRKMNTLFQITQIIQAELNAIRSHILEIIIILLIAIEVIPFVINIIKN